MIKVHRHHHLIWIDLESPTREDVRAVLDQYGLDGATAEELLKPSVRPKVEVFDRYLYLILHFPAFHHKPDTLTATQEVDFVIGNNFIITTRYENVDPVHRFSDIFEEDDLFTDRLIGEHAGFIFYAMVTRLYKSLHTELEVIDNELRHIEKRLFSGQEQRMVFELSRVSRDLLGFKQSLTLHREVLKSFEIAAKQFFGDSFSYYLHDILGSYYRVAAGVDASIEALRELRETNNALLNTKQNEIIKILTIISFVMLPLSLITSMLGMNVDMPFLMHPYAFPIVLAGLGVVALCTLLFFKFKRWF